MYAIVFTIPSTETDMSQEGMGADRLISRASSRKVEPWKNTSFLGHILVCIQLRLSSLSKIIYFRKMVKHSPSTQ